MNKALLFLFFICIYSCKQPKKETISSTFLTLPTNIDYAQGFTIEKTSPDVTMIRVSSPWPESEESFTYALVPKEKLSTITLNSDEYNAIIGVPVQNIVVTSTTHIPALEALGEADKLIGFPDTKYISSPMTRKRINEGLVQELGNNESLNSEMVIALNPEVVVGFSINHENKAYETIQRSNIPVVYNGDWTEETPLGKAEWIKFFAPFFQKEKEADSIFNSIKDNYNNAKALAEKAKNRPKVLSGALYKDIWYLPGGKSWASTFIADANAEYLWNGNSSTGSLSLSLESVIEHGHDADFWISPSQYGSYSELRAANRHYAQFSAYRNKNVYTYANSKGETGGLLYFELAPNRPDLVLKDLIHIFHPELLPNYAPTFFKPLD
ncbi:ABC transporter substrate-binding protein [Arenibacter troitsensis]|uniref:Iron complex transport system substrate-binding protein n=1 Tax=Arenibacter troitsensis TaxID=188872 RepID=A0A1X7LFW5_9FLAO|nr:ABC transporter substrate-binding protein [Arenibacter troitsensis]SMG52756.1 iron complex transport system substrate-binding protein [Arenibacter troitsensis]